MALRNYLVLGLSGTGKSSVCAELVRQGHYAIDADDELGYDAHAEHRSTDDQAISQYWFWDAGKVMHVIRDRSHSRVFVFGGCQNQDEFLHFFDKIFTLIADDDTLRLRLDDRQNPLELASHLAWNQHEVSHAMAQGRILIDATRPVAMVVDDLRQHIAAVSAGSEGQV